MSYNKGKNNPRYIDGRTNKIHYCVECKKNRIGITSYFVGKKRCKKCAAKSRKGISMNIGKRNGNFKNGLSTIQHYCKDCKIEISYKSKHCKSCAQKYKGNPRTQATRDKIAKAHFGKKHSLKTLKKLKNTLHRHHVDLNTENNKPSNILILSNSKHGRLHRYGYHYLVKTGQVRKYIRWFMKIYGEK
jgi:hypothetical protein